MKVFLKEQENEVSGLELFTKGQKNSGSFSTVYKWSVDSDKSIALYVYQMIYLESLRRKLWPQRQMFTLNMEKKTLEVDICASAYASTP